MAPSADARPVFLVGFMGSGKSAVGAAVAHELGFAFVDTDAAVERAAGCSVAEVFAREGGAGFRRREGEAFAALGRARRTVVATGGGLFLDAAARRRMRALGRTVWLDAPLERCRARVGDVVSRPRWIADDPAALRALYERRRATYALAELRVGSGSGDVADVAARVIRALAAANSS